MFYVHFCAHGRLNGLSDPQKVMKQNQRWNNLQIYPRQDSNTGGSDLWSNMLPLYQGGTLEKQWSKEGNLILHVRQNKEAKKTMKNP